MGLVGFDTFVDAKHKVLASRVSHHFTEQSVPPLNRYDTGYQSEMALSSFTIMTLTTNDIHFIHIHRARDKNCNDFTVWLRFSMLLVYLKAFL